MKTRYDLQQERLRHHLAQPENRIRYCYEFMKDFNDPEMIQHAFERSLEYIGQAENDGSDY